MFSALSTFFDQPSSTKTSTVHNLDDNIYKRRQDETIRDFLFRVGKIIGFPEFKEKFPHYYEASILDRGLRTIRDNILHSIVTRFKHSPEDEEALLSLTKLVLDNRSGLVSHENTVGDTPLHRAAELGQVTLIRAIHEHFKGLDNGLQVLQEAIGVTNKQGQTCLHIAIDKAVEDDGDLSLLNTLIDLADTKTLGAAEMLSSHTALHYLVDYNRCRIDKKVCPVSSCQECETTSYVTPDDFMATLRKMVQKNPLVLTVLDVEGQSPYQYHLATVEKNGKPTTNPSEPIVQSRLLPTSTPIEHQSPLKVVSQDLREIVEDYLCECLLSLGGFDRVCGILLGKNKLRTRFMPQNPLNTMTLEAHDMLKFNSRLAIVDVRLQPLTAGTRLSESNMQGLVSAATVSRDAWDQQRTENADHLEAVLKWLKDTKGVKQIIKLVVRDDKDGPCSDDVIERCLKTYDIRYLDWQKEDICVQTLLEGQAKNLVEVSLYSSGKDSTLWSWSSNDGLRRLEKLKKVTLNINPDGIETVERTKRNAEHFKKRVEEIPERQIHVDYHIDPPRGLEDPSPDKDQKIEDCHPWLGVIKEIRHGVNIARLEEAFNCNPNIKVALIDDGVCPEHELLFESIEEGWPADVSQNSKKPFYTSDNGHGTAMATYVQFVCPGVRLYVAKLDPESQETRAASAADAVKWAIERKVHVISMSWTIEITEKNETQIEVFEAQVRRAASRDIIMFCSGRDEAWNESSKSSYPAGSDTKKVYRVGSSDPYGNMSTWVNAGNVDYLLPGEALFPGDKLRGSSASTALASGLAALIIWCFEATGSGTDVVKKPDGMKKLFDSMVKGNKYLNILYFLDNNVPGNLNMAEWVVAASKLRLKLP